MPGPGFWQQRFRPWLRPQPSALPSDTGPQVVNQWAVTFAQPSGFTGTTPPALQSAVIALTPASSVGGGTGTPAPGSWLFAVCGWNQAGLAAATVGDADDIHSFWRPGDLTSSTWAVSTAAGATRTSIWYTPNLARTAGDVYVAPSGALAGQACLVIEVAGLGPWDTVTGIAANYAAAATSLNLALGAPAGPAFILAAVTGDSTAAGQALAPAGWSVLHATTASNGADHTCDAVLTPACLVTTGAVSVTATASSATDLSGVIIGVLTSAPSPVPATANPAWAGRMILEAAFGSGFETPPDQRTWTSLSDSAWPSADQGWKRFWSWSDDSGVPYALGQLQSGSGTVQLDNWDGALCPAGPSPWSFTASGTPAANTYFIVAASQAASISPGQAFTDTANPGSLFRVTGVGAPFAGFVNITFTPTSATAMNNPDVVSQVSPLTGVPVRLRMALGTLRDGTVVNRWYAWERNALAWPEKRNKALRGFVPLTLTDIWSVAGGTCPSPYRGEITQDQPYAWYPADDQPLTGGVLPSSLRNAAAGNTNALNIIVSPNGTGPDNSYGTDGTASGQWGYTQGIPIGLATYAVAADSGWMYGDPQSSPASAQSGNPVTASPGAAAWQTNGASGNTGSKGWFASCNDASFPPLANGITVEGWFRLPYFGTSTTFSSAGTHIIAQEPFCPISLITLTTGSNPVAILQLDTSGHLSLITYAGSTPTSHSVYSSSDLRMNGWFHVAATLTTSAWQVWVNGGDTAQVSGSGASMTSAWSWLVVNGDMGNTAGGGTTSSIRQGGNVQFSQIAVYPAQLPAWRIRAHYWAAVAGFGQLPAPTSPALQIVNATGSGTVPLPDGIFATGSYGLSHVNFTMSALVVAQAGGFTSGPSAWAVGGQLGGANVTGGTGYTINVQWTGLASSYAVYTASSVSAETQAAITAGPDVDFSNGYGGSATSYGPARTGGGSGASPPAAASSIGDTVAQRVERILGYGGVTCPNRAVDSTAGLLVKAALDVGGAQAGASLQNITDSDNGLMTVDNNNTLCYRSRAHLAADPVAWYIGMDVLAGMVPFDGSIEWSSDPQRVWDAITVTPYSPDGATLALVTPASAAAVNTAQRQYGVRPKNVPGYLQDPAKTQAAANWWFTTFGSLQRRASAVAVDAATHPAAWQMVAGMNPGDVVQVYDAPLGQPATTGNYRVSRLSRSVSYGANGGSPEARMVLVLDPIPPGGYWT